MNTVELKLFVQGYYNGNGTMKPVKFNQDGVSPTNEVETVTATLWFEFESSGNYHVSVHGVNSLEVFTTPVSYDFTITSNNNLIYTL